MPGKKIKRKSKTPDEMPETSKIQYLGPETIFTFRGQTTRKQYQFQGDKICDVEQPDVEQMLDGGGFALVPTKQPKPAPVDKSGEEA